MIRNLQVSAGNRAVAQLLETREADPTLTLQRQPADQAPAAEPTDSRTSAAGTITFPELDLLLPILSFSQQSSGTSRRKTSSGEIVVSIPIESMNSSIVQAMSSGKRFAVVTITIGTKATIKLEGVLISSLNVGGDTASVSLSFDSMEFVPGQ